MQLKTFEQNVPEIILERGSNYFCEGAVKDLQDMDNGQWFAIVEGNNDYEVEIKISKNGEVVDYDCNCPYDGEICKHIIAVLYQIREEIMISEPDSKTNTQSSWKTIISVVPENDLREFLLGYALKNKDFRNKLLTHFVDFDNTDNRSKYKQIIQDIFDTASGRDGYIDYYQANIVMGQVNVLLAKADNFLSTGIYTEAFYIAASVASESIKAIQYMDDSDGECSGAVNEAFDIISRIIESLPDESFKDEIYEWILNEAKNPDYNDYGCAEYLFPLILEISAAPEKEKDVLAFIDDQIEKVANERGWIKDYRMEKYLSLKIDIFRKNGRHEKADEIINNNLRVHDFRREIVEKHLSVNNYGEAIRLIKEGIDIAVKDNYAGIVTDWKEMLMEIYKKQNDVAKYRELAKELYFSNRHELKYYRQYKSTFSDEDKWKTELNNILEALIKETSGKKSVFSGMPRHIAELYIEEKMWKELYSLLKSCSDIFSLLEYYNYLVNDFHSELILLFKDAIIKEAFRVSDRKGYHTIANYLSKMSKIPGGKEAAGALREELLKKFYNRPAMKDEFNNISGL